MALTESLALPPETVDELPLRSLGVGDGIVAEGIYGSGDLLLNVTQKLGTDALLLVTAYRSGIPFTSFADPTGEDRNEWYQKVWSGQAWADRHRRPYPIVDNSLYALTGVDRELGLDDRLEVNERLTLWHNAGFKDGWYSSPLLSRIQLLRQPVQ